MGSPRKVKKLGACSILFKGPVEGGLAEEARTIEWEEARDEDEDKHREELLVVRVGKRKAVMLEVEEEEVDKLEGDGTAIAKWPKTLSEVLLDVEGPVSARFSLNVFDLLTIMFVV